MRDSLSKDGRFACPECKSTDCWRDEVDIGVGTICGPWRCNVCGWKDDFITEASEWLNNDCEDGCA